MKRLFCATLLILGAQSHVWAEENAGVPTQEQLAEEEKKVTAEEEHVRRGSPLVVYDKRGGPAKSAEGKTETTAARDSNAKGAKINIPTGGGSGAGSGSGSSGAGVPRKNSTSSSPSSPGAQTASAPAGPAGPEKNKDGACQSGGYRENAKAGSIEYARLKCQQQQLKDNKQLRNATAFALSPFVPAPILKDQMEKLK